MGSIQLAKGKNELVGAESSTIGDEDKIPGARMVWGFGAGFFVCSFVFKGIIGNIPWEKRVDSDKGEKKREGVKLREYFLN